MARYSTDGGGGERQHLERVLNAIGSKNMKKNKTNKNIIAGLFSKNSYISNDK